MDNNNGMKKETANLLGQLEGFLEEYLVKKAPFQLPEGLKEFIVKLSPYLTILMLILTLPIIFAAVGLSAFLAPFAMMGGYYWGAYTIIALIFSGLTVLLEIIAIPGLFKRTRKGWEFLFYAQIVSFIGSIISGGLSGLIGTLIGTLIGAYILFQVRDHYKN